MRDYINVGLNKNAEASTEIVKHIIYINTKLATLHVHLNFDLRICKQKNEDTEGMG